MPPEPGTLLPPVSGTPLRPDGGPAGLRPLRRVAHELEGELGDAGMAVDANGAWRVTVVLDAGQNAGNRVLSFGVDPMFGGLAGWQPGRRVHAATLAIP